MRAGEERVSVGEPGTARVASSSIIVLARESGKNYLRISGFSAATGAKAGGRGDSSGGGGGMNGATAERRTRIAGGSDAREKCPEIIIEASSPRRPGALGVSAAPRPARERRSAPLARRMRNISR